MIRREELELVIQKKKVSEVYNWLNKHFVTNSHYDYATSCPFLIIQGPTGCGKTTTLQCIANELRIQLCEYSETTDLTAINNELAREFNEEETNRSIEQRKASKFVHFVVNHIRFNPLYPPIIDTGPKLASAESEFESDDDDWMEVKKPSKPPVDKGVIIHVETPLSFGRYQKILIQNVNKLYKLIRELAKTVRRRVAIVFENLESDSNPLPSKVKVNLNIRTIKFNPITISNMKKFLENLLRHHNNLVIDRETTDLLINDFDGDLRACINTVKLLSNGSQYFNGFFLGSNNDDQSAIQNLQHSKRQKLNPETRRLHVNPTLLRDISKSKNFFHTLGKIFYQKRLYPERGLSNHQRRFRSVERPYAPENTIDSLVEKIGVNSKDLIAWLHQHYYGFCHDLNIDKAAMFLGHMSDVDNISINSTQSSQYYETHSTLDRTQLHLLIESTVFSLYNDQTNVTKSSDKKITTNRGSFIVKPSVENHTQNGKGDLYSFKRPVSLSLYKVVYDNRKLLDFFMYDVMKSATICHNANYVITDYIPYLNYIANEWSVVAKCPDVNGYINRRPKILEDDVALTLSRRLEIQESNTDFDMRHEKLQEVIDDIEDRLTKVSVKAETRY